ncbi:MAG: TetR/AcrR family transcriptional regulator C-terminal domain-containing protein, partial [Myxococcales bacterium]|nr:TetR/AcrR family transcriptional regulator C-terminal domain-containing protein [Myxococcales bacterium]
ALLDAYVFGAVLQELALPFQSPEEDAPVADAVMAAFPADQAPFLLEMITDHAMQPGYAFTDEFDWGLELVLDGLERRLTP